MVTRKDDSAMLPSANGTKLSQLWPLQKGGRQTETHPPLPLGAIHGAAKQPTATFGPLAILWPFRVVCCTPLSLDSWRFTQAGSWRTCRCQRRFGLSFDIRQVAAGNQLVGDPNKVCCQSLNRTTSPERTTSAMQPPCALFSSCSGAWVESVRGAV